MKEYHKIEGLFKREETRPHKLIIGEYRSPEVEMLKEIDWEFTEKIDGTNIRVMWDGHKVSFGGRTDNAQLPVPLYERLQDYFGGDVGEQMFEQVFGESEAMLCGEGYGAKIQKGGGNYKSDGVDFILFDVKVGESYLLREDIVDVASKFSLGIVPIILVGTVQQAVDKVKGGFNSTFGGFEAEGVVGKPKIELRKRNGERIIVKIKAKDFK